MALEAGTKLGPYEILSPLGAGGMGEVYRAKDSRLKREVAAQVLPASTATNAEALSRFQREAEAALLAVQQNEPILLCERSRVSAVSVSSVIATTAHSETVGMPAGITCTWTPTTKASRSRM